MAASRASSFRALTRLATGSAQVRRLHITGQTTFPSPLLTTERPAVNLPKNLAGLRDECQKRDLPTQGSKQELMDRISTDELVQTRGFSTAITADQKRPAVSEADAYMALPPNSTGQQPVRHFNTSRSLKAVNDSSTIDFAYFPDFNPDMSGPSPTVRVPLLPQAVGGPKNGSVVETMEEVMRPTIVTASADSTHISAVSALTGDDHADIDFGTMTGKVADATKRFGNDASNKMEDSERMVKTVWNSLLDDLFGPKSSKV